MKANLFFRGHLGLGDHILCNGLFRVLSKKYASSIIPVKSHNVDSVSQMFCDLNGIEILSVADDAEADVYANKYQSLDYDVVRVGYFGPNFDPVNWDESFYIQAGVDCEERWNKFYYYSDKEKESELYSSLCSGDDDYIFVHDDFSRQCFIDDEKLPDMKIVKPNYDLGYTIFDYGMVLHNASEIHCMDSSFACLIDHISSLKDKVKYIHRYVRPGGGPVYRNGWNIIT